MRPHGIVLDLDDTLLDTTGILIPHADRRAIELLGPQSPTDALSQLRSLRAEGVTDPIAELGRLQAVPRDRIERARSVWFDYDVPPLELDPRVDVALQELSSIAPLALLTQGVERTQRAKIARLGIAGRFEAVVVVTSAERHAKADALRALLGRLGRQPQRVVVVGDRLASDIHAANACGCRGIRVLAGEGRFDRPTTRLEMPWAEVEHVDQVAGLLRPSED